MVNRRSTSTTPEPILQLQRQLEGFQSSQSGRVKLPDSLWQAAVELARQFPPDSETIISGSGLVLPGWRSAANNDSATDFDHSRLNGRNCISIRPAKMVERPVKSHARLQV